MALTANMNIMIRAAEKAGRSLARDFGEVEQLQVSQKGPRDFVTAADLRSEEILHFELSKARPDFGFLMEEGGEKGDKNAEYRFIIDPLDGTTNFLHGLPHWCISIGLEHKGEIIAGLIHDPVKDETFRAEKGTGAFIRNKRLRVSGRSDFKRSMILTGSPGRIEGQDETFAKEYKIVRDSGVSIRRFGAAALDLAYVAAGRCEGFWERGLSPWDVAAGSLIVKEAGGAISDINTGKDPVFTGSVVAANGALFNSLKIALGKAK